MRHRIIGAVFSCVFFAVGLGACIYYHAADKPLLADNQHYFYIAERITAGVPPHISHIDPKNMLSCFMSAGAMKIGRVFGLDDISSGRALSVVITAASISLAWLLAYELSGSVLAGHLSALTMLCMWGLLHEGSMGMRPKVFVVFFLLLTHLQVTRKHWFKSGLSGAAAFLCWQPAIAVLGAAIAAALLRPRPLKQLVRVAAGALIAAGSYEAYFWWHGALAEQLRQAYIMPASTRTNPFELWPSLMFIVREGRPVFSIGRIFPEMFAVVMICLWLFIALRPRRAWHCAKLNPGWTAFWLSFHVCLAFTLLDHQAYPDLLLLQPYFAVALGCTIAGLINLMSSRALWPLRFVLGTICAALLLRTAWISAQRYQFPAKVTLEQQLKLGELVSVYLEHFDSVWAVGCTHLLGLNHVDNHIPYGFFFDDTVREVKAKPNWMPLKDGKLPDLILLSRGLYPGALSWRGRYYVDITPQIFRRHNVTVFRRRGPQPSFDMLTGAAAPSQEPARYKLRRAKATLPAGDIN